MNKIQVIQQIDLDDKTIKVQGGKVSIKVDDSGTNAIKVTDNGLHVALGATSGLKLDESSDFLKENYDFEGGVDFGYADVITTGTVGSLQLQVQLKKDTPTDFETKILRVNPDFPDSEKLPQGMIHQYFHYIDHDSYIKVDEMFGVWGKGLKKDITYKLGFTFLQNEIIE